MRKDMTIIPEVARAKEALDNVIRKSRVHLYKPIQVAEILYYDRTKKNINLLNLEEYRNKSKKWRDEICLPLLGRVCTSSAKFQDNLFENNALPPTMLAILGKENRRTGGAVEAYIYKRFLTKHLQLSKALDYCLNATAEIFDVKRFLSLFWLEPGLKRSIDKIYEIIVYALFSSLVEALDLQVKISVDAPKFPLLQEFESFSRKVMSLDISNPSYIQNAKVYRVGITNAADRGLDMYSNWGPAIQIKHLSLDVDLAQNIVESISSDRIVIVCKSAEKSVILSLLTQIGWRARIQSIITEDDLTEWYEKALRGTYSKLLSKTLISTLIDEISNEFPSVKIIPPQIKKRNYEKIHNSYWN